MSVLNINDLPEDERRQRLAELAKKLVDREPPILKVLKSMQGKRDDFTPEKIEWDEAPTEWVKKSHRVQLDPYTRLQIFKPGISKQ